MPTSSLVVAALVPLIIWRMYRRIGRLIGRQKSVAWRHWGACILFPVLLLLLAMGARSDIWSMGGLLLGVVVGIALAIFGLRLTRFEATPDGLFYTPNAHIGIALSTVLVCRIGYRVYQAMELQLDHVQAMQGFGRSPLTLVILGTMAGYYALYAAGLLRKRARLR